MSLVRAFALSIALTIPLFAHAAAQRTFVSVAGADANPCTVAQPCRSFATAITQTFAGGEVIALDSGGYGPVTIAKSVSIVAPQGVYAGISVFPGGDGVTVAASATDKVILRGLAINSVGGWRGVNFTGGGSLAVDRCTISGNFTFAILVAGPTDADVLVNDTRIAGASNGLWVSGPGGESIRLSVADTVISDVEAGVYSEAGLQATLDRVQVIGRGVATSSVGIGIQAVLNHTPARVHVARSLVRAFAHAVLAQPALSFGTYVNVTIASSELAHNGLAVYALTGATIALTDVRVVHNNMIAVTGSGGTIQSAGDNHQVDNAAFGNPVSGPSGQF